MLARARVYGGLALTHEFQNRNMRTAAPRLIRAPRHRRVQARSACDGKRYLPPPCVNYVGQDGNAALAPFEKTRPVNARGGRKDRGKFTEQPRLHAAADRSAAAHHDASLLKPRSRKDGHHGPRSSDGAALTDGRTRETRCCCAFAQHHERDAALSSSLFRINRRAAVSASYSRRSC